MKFVICLSALLVVALADDPHGLKPVHDKCQSDPVTHVDESVFDELRKTHGNSSVPANFNKHIVCITRGLNLTNEDGTANIEEVKTHVGHTVQDLAKIDTIVQECAVNKATTEETARHIWKCLHQNNVFSGEHQGHHQHHDSHESGSHESGEHHHHHHHHNATGDHEHHHDSSEEHHHHNASGEHHHHHDSSEEHHHEHNHTHSTTIPSV